MSRQRWVVSAFLAWHLAAIAVGAIPAPQSLAKVEVRSPASPSLKQRVTYALDLATAGLATAHAVLWRVTGPVRIPAKAYLSLFSLAQPWGMFSNPPQTDQYARVRYYVKPESGPVWAATELVMPAHREDKVRLLASFQDSYRDKAIAIASDDFYRRRRQPLIRPDTRSAELPDDLAPVGRYFARAFERQHLDAGKERITRIEVWLGSSPTPPPGTPVDEGARREHMALLQRYFDGPVEHRLAVPSYPMYHSVDQEGDIHWLLEYFEEP